MNYVVFPLLLLLPAIVSAAESAAIGSLANAEETVLVERGVPRDVQYVGGKWIPGDESLIGRGDLSRMFSKHEIGKGDFHIKARLILPRLQHLNPEVGIGPYSYVQLDANGGRIIIGGPLFVPDEQMIRYTILGKNDDLISAGKPFLFEAIGRGDQIQLLIDGQLIHTQELLRQDIGPVSLFPGSGEMHAIDVSVIAEQRKPFTPGNITSYGVELDARLTWRPELRKANYVTLRDGVIAYLNNHNLTITRDEGKTWEMRKGTVLSDKYGSELTFSSGILLRTRSNMLIAALINAKNYVHLEWGDEANKAVAGRREVWTMRSADEGRTWQDVQRIYGGYCGALVDMIQTSSGNIVVPVQEFLFDRNTNITRAYVSADEGQTWRKGNTLDIGGFGNHAGIFEPTLAERSDGRLLMLMRTNLDYLYAAWSDADGLSWRKTRPSQFDASSSPAFLTKLASGRLLLVWNRVYPVGQKTYRRRIGKWSETPVSWCREEVSLAITDETGTRWSDPVLIARKPGHWMAYPYVFEPQPGRLWLFASGGLRVELRESDFVDE